MVLTIQRYHAGDFPAALKFAEIAAALQPFCAGLITRVEHAMFYALAMTACHMHAAEEERRAFDAKLEAVRASMRRWASLCPENTEHMQRLVEAECARVRGARMEAAELYDRAIVAARANRYINIEALAAELAARFWLSDGKPEFARIYLEKALDAYEAWGATGKAADLRTKHGLAARRGATALITQGSTTLGPAAESSDALDLATLLEASQAIAGEIVLERLLVKLMDIICENAGAESVVIVLEQDGEFLVQGIKTASGTARVPAGEPLGLSAPCSTGIVNYVLRTSELVVLDDAARQGRYRNDAYVENRRPKSVLCAPVMHKGRLIGAVYLENNQVAGAFTPGRLEALKILMSQMAVSIENATLYSRQEQQSRAIEAANVSLTKEIAERKKAEAELKRYKDHLEDLVKERTRELEKAQGRLVELSRRAGMAEMASGVLHNVGNVMNSVNVGAGVARDMIGKLPVEGLARVVALLDEYAGRLAEFLTADPVGRKVPEYLRKLSEALSDEKDAMLRNIDQLAEHIEHMKKIIAAQQSYAKRGGMTEVCTLEEIAEAAIAINEAGLRNGNIEVIRSYEKLPAVLVDRHQSMQILVNLVSNAKHALEEVARGDRRLWISIAKVDDGVRIEVRDNGIGIAAADLPKIFSHGFTTKRTGHGFGLHNCASAAQQMDGSLTAYSDGPGRGASFVLRLPVEYAEDAKQPVKVAAAEAAS